MRVLSIFLIFISSFNFAQISLTNLNSTGINSEKDLRKIGVSQNKIEELKKEYEQSREIDKSKIESSNLSPTKENSNSDKEIQLESKKDTSYLESVYGQSIFRDGAVSIKENSDRVMPSSFYTLGTGDRLSVTIWGNSQFSGEFTLDEFGNITPNLVGRINLKGKTFNQAERIIKRRFGGVYRFNSSQIAINLSYSKVISVNIVGEVISPGTFNIPAINSAFNILSLSKGLNSNGSVRNIAIVRNGQTVGNLDIYEFMTNPKKNSFLHLFDGDFISVPALGNVVNLKGEVNKVGSYEIKENETFRDLLKFSGGFKPLANKTTINFTRQSSHGKIVYSYKLEEAMNLKLQNGDEITVSKNSENISNKISIEGEVFSPGSIEFKDGITFGDLLNTANGLTPEAYLKSAHIYRLQDNMERELIKIDLSSKSQAYSTELKDLDEVLIFNKKSFIDSTFVIANGFVRNGGKIEYKSKMTIRDLLLISGGTLPQADLSRIEIERVNFLRSKNDTSNYVNILTKNIVDDSKFELEPFDVVNIRPLPEFRFHEFVKVTGEVKYPGAYSLNDNKVKTSDIIKRAGGLTNLAYGKKAFIEREEDSLGIILLDLELVIENSKSPFNYSLRPGDKIVVPRVNDIVSISGAIGSQFINNEVKINVPFKKGKRASHYIKKYSGGYAKEADKKSVYAITLNGQVKRSKRFGFIKPKIEKGDKIIVRYNQKKEKKNDGKKINWNNQIENATLKLTGLITLWILINGAVN